ncbi:MAG: DMT family transporter [Planctomycetota bacterium]
MQAALLTLGVFAGSTAVLFIKESQVDSVLLAAVRLLGAAVLLTPLYVRDLRRHGGGFRWRDVRASLAPGVALGVHLITWNAGCRLTLAANATLIVNLVPLVMPLLLAWLAAERLNRSEAVATAVAMLGIGLLFLTDYRASIDHFRGDAICFGSMVLLAVYLVLGRRHRHKPTVWLYMVPLFYAAGLASLACVPLFAVNASVDWSREWIWVAALVLIPTVCGHTLINNAMRAFRGQLVALATMCQFVFAAPLAWWQLGETPSWSFHVAAALAVAGGAIGARAHHKAKRTPVGDTSAAAAPMTGEPVTNGPTDERVS